MGMVDITVNGRRHQVQCGDGEEPRLRRLAAYVDSCAAKLLQQHGQLPDAKVLLLTSLLVADELSDAYEEIKRLKAAGGRAASRGPRTRRRRRSIGSPRAWSSLPPRSRVPNFAVAVAAGCVHPSESSPRA